MTIILFLLLLSIIIVIHELGHLFTAKCFGVYCYEFSFGMGPKLWSRQGKETCYSIRAIPIGGYVSMAGEQDGDEAYPEVHVDPSRTLDALVPWKKIIIMIAGVLMNFLLAWVIFAMIILSNGAFAISGKAEVASVLADSPAEKAGFQVGDVVKSITTADGTTTHPSTFQDMQLFLSDNTDTLTYVVQRGDQQVSIQVTPEYNASQGIYMIGITGPDATVIPTNLLNCWAYGGQEMIMITKLMLSTIQKLFHGIGVNNLSGPVGIYSATETYASYGFASYMFLVAELSLNVGIINLLPLPVLDGGRVVITICEWIAHRKLNKKVETAIMGACWVLLIALMVMVTWNDLMRIFQG